MRKILFFILALFVQGSFAQKILFVGNSLTYANDLPSMVESIAKQYNVKLTTSMIALPNYSLEDHWFEGKVQEQIKATHFDYVIFQQGPSALPASRANLIEFAIKYATFCKTNKAKAGFYMVWPSADRSFDFGGVIRSYTLAADTTKSILFPVGKAWQQVWAREKNFPLYSADAFHPSEHGTMMAALVIFAKLFPDKDLQSLQLKKLNIKSVSEEQFSLMKQSAAEVLKN